MYQLPVAICMACKHLYHASFCHEQCCSVGHTALQAQHLHCSCLISVLSVGYMVEKPSTVDEAIAYVWDVSDTVIGPADKQRLAAALAERTDAVARRYFSEIQGFGWAP